MTAFTSTTTLFLALSLLLSSSTCSSASLPPFYAVAHMANSIRAVTWALNNGANGLEMDLRSANPLTSFLSTSAV